MASHETLDVKETVEPVKAVEVAETEIKPEEVEEKPTKTESEPATELKDELAETKKDEDSQQNADGQQQNAEQLTESKEPTESTDDKTNGIESKETESKETATQVTPDNVSSSSHSIMSGYSVGLSIDSGDSDGEGSYPTTDDDQASIYELMSNQSSSRSANTSVYQFVEEFGRTFHRYKEGKYYLPNDEQEQARLDLQHAIAKRVLNGRLGIAPLDPASTHRVLDIGTGTGIWAIDFADEHPAADVLGVDLSPIQPDYVPANCRFEIDDVDDEWTWRPDFDYIHGRYVVAFLKNVPQVVEQAYAHLKPGGWFELFEGPMVLQSVDGTIETSALRQWNNYIDEGVRRMGRDPLAPLKLHGWFKDAGFVNITERRLALPLNSWPRGRENKLLGAMEMTNLLEAAQGMTSVVLTKALGWSIEEVEIFLTSVRRDLKDRNIHAYRPVVVICGQKPL